MEPVRVIGPESTYENAKIVWNTTLYLPAPSSLANDRSFQNLSQNEKVDGVYSSDLPTYKSNFLFPPLFVSLYLSS